MSFATRLRSSSVAVCAVLAVALALRANLVTGLWWDRPGDVHHLDEVLLMQESLSALQGVPPREIGWPAATSRLALSATYGVMMLGDLRSRISADTTPPRVFEAMAEWSAAQWAYPGRLFVAGRTLTIVTGVCQVAATYWAVSRWNGPVAGIWAASAAALSPIAIRYSQFVLADMAGVLFSTLALGVLAPGRLASSSRPLLAGALAGLAMASKFHFVVWALPVLVASAIDGSGRIEGVRVRRAALAALGTAVALVCLVPWIWINPVLAAKEFSAVALSKISEGHGVSPFNNLIEAFRPCGWLALVPACWGLWLLARAHRAHALLPLGVLALNVAIVATATQVYDRYGLPALPVLCLATGMGVAAWMNGNGFRVVRLTVVAALVVATLGQVRTSQLEAGRRDAYGLAHDWLTANMPEGSRIAVPSLYPRFLPRTRRQLLQTAAYADTTAAYARKWKSNGYEVHSDVMPMRLAVMNDELFHQHWARVELAAGRPGGFEVVLHDDAPRFNSILTTEAVRFFVEEKGTSSQIDALLMARPIEGLEPSVTFAGEFGLPLYLYRPAEAGGS